MLWHKSWLDTRFRFLIGLALLLFFACSFVLVRPRLMEMLPMIPADNFAGELGRLIKANTELARTFRGYVFSQWFMKTPTQLGTLFAVILGSGSVLSFGLKGGTMFTLSLPVSRDQLLRARAAMGLGELFVMCVVPSLFICVIAPSIGERYAPGDALVHGISLFVGTSVFFSVALLLSTIFDDLWRPLLITLCLSMVIAMLEGVITDMQYGVFGVMSGTAYFRTGHLPWLALIVLAGMSGLMIQAATVSLRNRDF